jgi:hypothetical protein
MPQIAEIPDDALASIAEQVGKRLPVGLAEACKGSALELGESLPVMMLPPKEVAPGRGRLRGRVQPTGRWHHQVMCGEVAEGYATSVAPDGEGQPWRVVAVGRSGFPQVLEKVLDGLDEQWGGGEATVSLLDIPVYATTVLWLEFPEEDKLVFTTGPAGNGSLEYSAFYAADEFLKLLSAQKRPSGVPVALDERLFLFGEAFMRWVRALLALLRRWFGGAAAKRS